MIQPRKTVIEFELNTSTLLQRIEMLLEDMDQSDCKTTTLSSDPSSNVSTTTTSALICANIQFQNLTTSPSTQSPLTPNNLLNGSSTENVWKKRNLENSVIIPEVTQSKSSNLFLFFLIDRLVENFHLIEFCISKDSSDLWAGIVSGKYKPTSSDPNDYSGMAKPSSMSNFMANPVERKLLRSQTLVESMATKTATTIKNPSTTITGTARFQQKNLIGIGDHAMNGALMKQRNSLAGDSGGGGGDRIRTSQRTESGSSASSSRRSSIVDQHGNGFTVVGSGRKYTISGSSTNSNSSKPSETSTGKVLKNNFINTSKVYKNSRPNEKPMFY